MYTAIPQPLTFEEFLAWNDDSGNQFELDDGIPSPLSEPNTNQEDLVQRLCAYLENRCLENSRPKIPQDFAST